MGLLVKTGKVREFYKSNCKYITGEKTSQFGYHWCFCDKMKKDINSLPVEEKENVSYFAYEAIENCGEETEELEILKFIDNGEE